MFGIRMTPGTRIVVFAVIIFFFFGGSILGYALTSGLGVMGVLARFWAFFQNLLSGHVG